MFANFHSKARGSFCHSAPACRDIGSGKQSNTPGRPVPPRVRTFIEQLRGLP